jgi:A-type inclusion protein
MSQLICEANHLEELNALRDRIAELERMLAERD